MRQLYPEYGMESRTLARNWHWSRHLRLFRSDSRGRALAQVLSLLLLLLAGTTASAHNVSSADQSALAQSAGTQLILFTYLGAKHMVTGYDHLLFLVGVIFFLYQLREVALYVTLFAIGHSTTLLLGVLAGIEVNPYLIDAVIGLSVVYKALDNLDAFRTWFGVMPNQKAAVLLFGFCHGLGLSSKLQELKLSPEGLVPNMIAFNVGVELGQFLALGAILIAMNYWRSRPSFMRHAYLTNVALMASGFLLAGLQLSAYVFEAGVA
jgi:HupE / UreJ protein